MLHLENIIRKYSSLICLFGVFYISLHDIIIKYKVCGIMFWYEQPPERDYTNKENTIITIKIL